MKSSNALPRQASMIPRALLLVLAVLPGVAEAQESEQVRSIQDIFAPVGAPAEILNYTAILVLLICLGIFVVVGGLLFYAAGRYGRRPGDYVSDPPQVYGSTEIELGWTVPPK